MRLIISMINVRPLSGPFTVFRMCCEAASQMPNVRVTALCHSLEDIKCINAPNVNFIAYPLSQKSWLFRLFYEYIYFKFLAKKLKPDFWLSLHDMTPNIGKICPQAVYCHNATPFYKASWKDLYYSPSVFLFSMFYKYLYRINIHANRTVIVQQNWIRKEFEKMYNLNNVLIAFPLQPVNMSKGKNSFCGGKVRRFIYASRPRPFKNFELIGAAAEILYQRGIRDIEFILTIDGAENRYSQDVYRKYHNCPLLKFVGCLNQEELQAYYDSSEAMTFPSKLETWGMVVEEALNNGLPVIVSDKVGCAEEIVEDGINGFTVPVNDEEALSAAFKKICIPTVYNPLRKNVCSRNYEEIEQQQINAYL